MDQASVSMLVNLSRDIAQTNLGYLSISVLILGSIVYFNTRPIKEALDKQEDKIKDLKDEANSLLIKSQEQSEKTLNEFKINQANVITSILEQQKNENNLEIENKNQQLYNDLSDKIEIVSENKDEKLREIIISEVNNNLATLDKNLTLGINTTKSDINKEFDSFRFKTEAVLKGMDEVIKELQVYKHSKEGQVGAIIFSIELLKDSIDDYLETKKRFNNNIPTEDRALFGWKVEKRLKELIKEIGDFALDKDLIVRIDQQIKNIKNEAISQDLINQLVNKTNRTSILV